MKKLFLFFLVSSMSICSIDEDNFMRFYTLLARYQRGCEETGYDIMMFFQELPKDVASQLRKDLPLFFAKTARGESVSLQVVLDYIYGRSKDASIKALVKIITDCYKELGIGLSQALLDKFDKICLTS